MRLCRLILWFKLFIFGNNEISHLFGGCCKGQIRYPFGGYKLDVTLLVVGYLAYLGLFDGIYRYSGQFIKEKSNFLAMLGGIK